MNERVDNFEQPIPDYRMPESESYNSELIVQLDGFEGPIDLLLALAREQKVDLTKISILGLAEQYLTFIDEAKKMDKNLNKKCQNICEKNGRCPHLDSDFMNLLSDNIME